MAQIGIAISTLGSVMALMGMFPGVTGLDATPGIGVLQIVMIIIGFGLLISGALLYVQGAFYRGVKHNLAQKIAVRLSATGLLFTAIAGMGDLFGFGSNPQPEGPILGMWQAFGLVGGFVFASFGVVLFALLGPDEDDDAEEAPVG